MPMSAQCPTCLHFIGYDDNNIPRCHAFPQGIPGEIMTGYVDHTKPVEGDNGIRYEKILEDGDVV
jgi:hypothetical protein